MAVTSYTTDELVAALDFIGVAQGENIVMHSSLFHLGKLHGYEIKSYPSHIVSCIRAHLGENGTLAVPASNWDYGLKRQPFDVRRSSVTKELGVVGSYVAALPECQRSPNPIFSVAVLGANADYVCGGGVATAFGFDSAWDRLFRLNADMIFLGCKLNSMTFVRYIEHRFGVPYLYNKLFDVQILDDKRPIDAAVVANLRYAHCPAEYDLSAFGCSLIDAGALRQVSLGGGKIMAVRMNHCFDIGIEGLKKDIHFFLARRPSYVAGREPIF